MSAEKLSRGAIIAVAATGLVLTMLTSGLLMSSQTLPSVGTVTTVDVCVYSDSRCTRNLTFIDWEALKPGEVISKTVYVENNGTVPVTLTMRTDNWVPENADSFITLTWDRQDYILSASRSIQAVLTLSVSANIVDITDFSFEIIIIGTE